MLFPDELVVIRGGGDLATGVAWRLSHAGFPVVVSELAHPLTVRRTVALSTAVLEGEVVVEGLLGRCTPLAHAAVIARNGVVAVVVEPGLPRIGARVLVDARMAKRNLDTTIHDAPLVVALGPGFTAGVDCHAVVETMRGAHLGRVRWSGSAAPDSGTPGELGGHGPERVLRAAIPGRVQWQRAIGDRVGEGEVLGEVVGEAGDATVVRAPFGGLVRGLIASGTTVAAGVKIGDLDSRPDASWDEVSDKALAVGGGVLEAVLTRLGDGP